MSIAINNEQDQINVQFDDDKKIGSDHGSGQNGGLVSKQIWAASFTFDQNGKQLFNTADRAPGNAREQEPNLGQEGQICSPQFQEQPPTQWNEETNARQLKSQQNDNNSKPVVALPAGVTHHQRNSMQTPFTSFGDNGMNCAGVAPINLVKVNENTDDETGTNRSARFHYSQGRIGSAVKGTPVVVQNYPYSLRQNGQGDLNQIDSNMKMGSESQINQMLVRSGSGSDQGSVMGTGFYNNNNHQLFDSYQQYCENPYLLAAQSNTNFLNETAPAKYQDPLQMQSNRTYNNKILRRHLQENSSKKGKQQEERFHSNKRSQNQSQGRNKMVEHNEKQQSMGQNQKSFFKQRRSTHRDSSSQNLNIQNKVKVLKNELKNRSGHITKQEAQAFIDQNDANNRRSTRRPEQERSYLRRQSYMNPSNSNFAKRDSLSNNVDGMIANVGVPGAVARTVGWNHQHQQMIQLQGDTYADNTKYYQNQLNELQNENIRHINQLYGKSMKRSGLLSISGTFEQNDQNQQVMTRKVKSPYFAQPFDSDNNNARSTGGVGSTEQRRLHIRGVNSRTHADLALDQSDQQAFNQPVQPELAIKSRAANNSFTSAKYPAKFVHAGPASKPFKKQKLRDLCRLAPQELATYYVPAAATKSVQRSPSYHRMKSQAGKKYQAYGQKVNVNSPQNAAKSTGKPALLSTNQTQKVIKDLISYRDDSEQDSKGSRAAHRQNNAKIKMISQNGRMKMNNVVLPKEKIQFRDIQQYDKTNATEAAPRQDQSNRSSHRSGESKPHDSFRKNRFKKSLPPQQQRQDNMLNQKMSVDYQEVYNSETNPFKASPKNQCKEQTQIQRDSSLTLQQSSRKLLLPLPLNNDANAIEKKAEGASGRSSQRQMSHRSKSQASAR